MRTSSYCTNGGCVGIVRTTYGVDVVDTKSGAEGAVLRISDAAWSAFVARTKNGAFDSAR